MTKFAIKSYTMSINGEPFGEEKYCIDTIIRALQAYGQEYNG